MDRVSLSHDPPLARAGTVYTVQLAGRPEAAAEARQWVGTVAAIGGASEEITDDARLLVSEVVTNAVVHSASRGREAGVTIQVTVQPGRLTVEVADAGGPAAPMRRADSDGLDAHGRGLDLLDLVAADWGVRGDLGGRVVWFALIWEGPNSDHL